MGFSVGKQNSFPTPKTWDEFYRLWGAHFVLMGHRAFQLAQTQHLMGVRPTDDLLDARLERQLIFERHPDEVKEFEAYLRKLEAKEQCD